jgi:hypothetical protein
MAPRGLVYFVQKFQTWIKKLAARARLLVAIALHKLLRLAHNFSFGVDLTHLAVQNNGTS